MTQNVNHAKSSLCRLPDRQSWDSWKVGVLMFYPPPPSFYALFPRCLFSKLNRDKAGFPGNVTHIVVSGTGIAFLGGCFSEIRQGSHLTLSSGFLIWEFLMNVFNIPLGKHTSPQGSSHQKPAHNLSIPQDALVQRKHYRATQWHTVIKVQHSGAGETA